MQSDESNLTGSKYADDSTLGAAGGTLDVIEQKLNPDICNAVN